MSALCSGSVTMILYGWEDAMYDVVRQHTVAAGSDKHQVLVNPI